MPASKLGVSPRGRLRADHRLCRQGRPSRESANRGPPLARLLLFFHRRITAVRPAVNREGGGSNPPGGAASHSVPVEQRPSSLVPQTRSGGSNPPRDTNAGGPRRLGYLQKNTQARHLSAFVQFRRAGADRLSLNKWEPRVRRPLSDRHNSFVGFCLALPVSRSGWVIVNQRYQRPSCTTRSPVFISRAGASGLPLVAARERRQVRILRDQTRHSSAIFRRGSAGRSNWVIAEDERAVWPVAGASLQLQGHT